MKTKIKKLLYSLQKKDGKDFLVSTLFISNLGILKVNIEVESKKIVLFEKKSFMDFLKIVGGKKGKKDKENNEEKKE